MALEERLLPARQRDPVHPLAGERQPQAEQEALDFLTGQPGHDLPEVDPYFAQRQVQDFGAEHGILTQAWSPIGGITFYRDGSHGSTSPTRSSETLPLPTARPPPR